MELNREQIIKALECCSKETCEDCPYANEDIFDTSCGINMAKDALALIKELTEENERLRAECENQSLLWKKHFESIYETAKETVKADTVRKMQERIKEHCIKGGIYPAFVASTIDQIAKEMVEEK